YELPLKSWYVADARFLICVPAAVVCANADDATASSAIRSSGRARMSLRFIVVLLLHLRAVSELNLALGLEVAVQRPAQVGDHVRRRVDGDFLAVGVLLRDFHGPGMKRLAAVDRELDARVRRILRRLFDVMKTGGNGVDDRHVVHDLGAV